MGGIFEDKGFSPEERKHLFYMICIFLRLLIAGIVYNLSSSKYIQYTLLIISLFAIYSNYTKLCDIVWWSRRFHLIIAIALFIVTALTITKKLKSDKYMAYLLYADVFFGVIHSLIKQPFT